MGKLCPTLPNLLEQCAVVVLNSEAFQKIVLEELCVMPSYFFCAQLSLDGAAEQAERVDEPAIKGTTFASH